MKDLFVLLAHFLVTAAKLLGPGGAKTIVAENLLMKQQLLIINRTRQRAPNLSTADRLLLGFWSLFLNPRRLIRSAVIIKPSTLLKFHTALMKRKYRLLYSSSRQGNPGPKGPSRKVIRAIVELKQRDPRFGCPRIAQQISKVFGINIDKDVVRRVLTTHYRPGSDDGGPSWLTFLGHARDSLWSIDLFCCESILMKTHWVMVVMDQYTRRIIGFGIQEGNVDGMALGRMFNQAISGQGSPRYLSTDNDPLFKFHRWKANLRILEVEEIKSVPFVARSHPFIERLIGTIRREYLDHVFFWNVMDLERKLQTFQEYYNHNRVHAGLDGNIPGEAGQVSRSQPAKLANYRWQTYCGGLFEIPLAA